MTAFASFAVSASTACTSCKQPLPLNGATESVLCDACRTPVATPAALWKEILAEALDETAALAEGEGRNSTMILPRHGMTVEIEYGKLAPRCSDCKAAIPLDRAAALLATPQGGELACAGCQKPIRVRPAPPWFRVVHEGVAGFVGESAPGGASSVTDPHAVRFHCYHCGGNLPLDGKARSVVCSYCRAHVTVPDEIWVRLHPVAVRKRWFALLGGDHAAPGLPADAWAFCDLEVGPDGGMIVAFHADDEGPAGHRARLVRVDPRGRRLWEQDGIAFGDDIRLGLSPGDARLVIQDRDEDYLRFVDSATGKPVGTLKGGAKTPRGGDGFTLRDAQTIAFDWDGTILVERSWDDDGYESGHALRRFARDGSRLPTWPGLPIKNVHRDAPAWQSLRHKPEQLPEDARLHVGWDGFVYVYCRKLSHVAKLARDGSLLGVLPVPAARTVIGDDLEGFGAARDGMIYVLAPHAARIGDTEYPHVFRLAPNGALQLLLGPHAPNQTFIGRYTNKLRVFPDGSLHLAYALDSLRIIGPTGTVTWRSRPTTRSDETQLEELAKDRRGKRLAADS